MVHFPPQKYDLGLYFERIRRLKSHLETLFWRKTVETAHRRAVSGGLVEQRQELCSVGWGHCKHPCFHLPGRAQTPHTHRHTPPPPNLSGASAALCIMRLCGFFFCLPEQNNHKKWNKWIMDGWFEGSGSPAWMPADWRDIAFMDWSPSSPEQIWGECERWGAFFFVFYARLCEEDERLLRPSTHIVWGHPFWFHHHLRARYPVAHRRC